MPVPGLCALAVKSNRVLVRQFCGHHFVYCIRVRRHEEKNVGTDNIQFTPVPVPRDGAQIFSRAPIRSSVQTSARAREPGTGT